MTKRKRINKQHSKKNSVANKLALPKIAKKDAHQFLKYLNKNRLKSLTIIFIGILITISVISFFIVKYYTFEQSYSIGKASSLLKPINQSVANKLNYDKKQQVFNFDSGKITSDSLSSQIGSSQITATLSKQANKGVSITDSTNKVNFTLKPKFKLNEGKKDGNRIVYPTADGTGWLVYTMQNTGVKEDIILNNSNDDNISFDYELVVPDGLEARIESDGGIGVYGNTIFSGDVATSTESDAALLKKARQNAKKDTLLFNIPKPFVNETGKTKSDIKVTYSLNGNNLRVQATGLKNANYPLSIDPSIYVATAQQFMNGNNETNINFNVDDKLIEKSRTTGARFDSWHNTTPLTTSSWGGGSVAAGGFIYSIGGTSFNGQIYNTQGSDTFTVPSGITSITVKMWGGGGGGGAGGSAAAGGNGAGGGYVNATYSVTPGEVLTVYVGGAGSGGLRNTAGGGGGGGGFSSIYRSSSPLAIAAGGGGGGGGRNSSSNIGGAGGAGGGTSGIAGSASGTVTGGGGGTQTAGGNGGTSSNNPGSAGTSLTGGSGADGRTSAGNDGSGAAGGLASGGDGGIPISTSRSGGGGGGAGYFGGGGGGGSVSNSGAGGGGGGSSYTAPGATGVTNTAGSGINPGNPSDSYRNGAGNGGANGAIGTIGNVGSNGLIVITYGTSTSKVAQSVNWAKFNTTSGEIDSANPGSGTCSGWCTTAAYNLPSARTNFSLVAYNGFLYAIGGVDSAGNKQNTVYIAKLGANGEPQLWHPNDITKNNWVYWYQDTSISSARSDMSAVAYNNRLYLTGGRTASSPVNVVEYADIKPTGTLGIWTASTNLPSNLYGHSTQVYNDRLYIIGGEATVGGVPSNSVYYIKINNDGSLNNWVQTTSFTTGRFSNGGNFSVVWGAYIYISGGCNTVNVSGYCTAISSDTQVASINADGSIDTWNSMANVTSSRMGFGMISWRDKIYEIGGCTSQDTVLGACASTSSDIIYGSINQDGDASTVAQSVPSGSSPCSGTSPTDCNLPGTSYVGNMLNQSVITNGYLYIIGGCVNDGCNTTSGNTAYVAISSTGEMTKPATCPGGTYQGGSWCVNTANSIAGGIAGSSPVVFGGRIYLVGGFGGAGNKGNSYYATVNNDGSLSAWTTQTMASIGATSVSYSFAYVRANPSSASTIPGNLYIFGGCTVSNGAGCSGYTGNVFKCNIQASGPISNCSTSGQLQIGTIPGDYQSGLAIHSGTVYANYVYLIGGVSPNIADLATVRYAKIDNNNNVVAVSGNTWTESDKQMAVGRRRSASFGYNGYIYVVGGYDGTTGAGVLADIEFVKVNVSDGSLGDSSKGFVVSSVTINQRWGLNVPVSNSYAYVIGGCTTGAAPSACSARTDIIQTFQIYNNDSGTPAGYTTSANTYTTNPNRIGASSTILNGYIYTAGGCISVTDCTTATNNVSYAPINANGALGAWSSTTANLPDVRAWGKLKAAGGSLYYIGGQSSTATDRRSEIYYGTPSSGNITSWNTASSGLPSARTKFGATVWNNRLYVVGGEGTGTGCTASNVCNTVYVSPQLNSGGNISSAWSTNSTSFNVARSGAAVTAYANNLYLFGGYDGTNYLSDSQYSQINSSTGDAGNWTFSTSLPLPLSQAESFAANGYIYLIGGRSSTTTCDSISLVTPVSANTTIATGNNPTGIGDWYETNQRFSGSRYGAAAAYYDGKAYVLGGGCGTTLTYASPATQQTALLSQPQVAKYSIMIDTDSDVFPNSWLLNGVDNSIGAKWQLKYRSMTNTTTSCVSPAMTTWGRETVFGDVTLGLPGVYTPKDGNGVSTNCARFYYFNVTVDSSQAFGYPDDVSRGPTITDLTMQFTADPSKRLMHGRTFTGGIQQPIDTPYYTQ